MSVLDGNRWRAVSPLLDQAMDMSPQERRRWLGSLRAEDAALADDVESLLQERSLVERDGFLEAGAVAQPPSLAGQTLGAYTLLSLVGQGGMGNVWLARRSDGRFEGEAAVKLLNIGLVGRAGEERFRREGSILARLAHPHIARLVDAGVSAAGQPYLVLEHVAGEQIDRYCDRETLDVETRLRLFLDVLAAVAHAHANLIVHRDIKPSNVLIGADGCVKLLDFGIAKLLEGEAGTGEATELTREGGRALTPEYAAPEQVSGDAVTTATDVYALGILLYVLLTGRHPAGPAALRSTADLYRAIVDTEPQRPSDSVSPSRTHPAEALADNASHRATSVDGLRRALKGDLDTIVAKALKKNPQERYTSVTAMADDVERYLDSKPIRARPDTLAYRTRKFVGRHRQGVAAAVAALLSLAGLVGFYTARLAAERDRARLEAQKAAKVSELLTGLLTGADPYGSHQAKEPTVRAILDAGAQRVEKELAGQPELQAEMLTVMGKVYQRLGLREKAQPLLERGLQIGRATFGSEHERVAQSLNDLGVLLGDEGKYPAAAAMLEQALAMRRRVLGTSNKDVAVTMVELGRVYSDQGDDRRAESLFRESLAIRTKVLGKDDHETAVSKGDLALLLWHRGDFASAESLYKECLETFRKLRGDDDPDVAATLNNLGLIAGDKGDPAAAEALFREALRIDRKTLGETHPRLANVLNNLSNPLRSEGKYDEAVAVLEEALRIATPELGEHHPQIASYKVSLARVDLARGQAAEAEPLLREALRIRRRTYPPEDWRIAIVESVLGEALTSTGQYGEAESLLLHAQRVLRDVPGQQGREAQATPIRLAALYKAWGRLEKAAARPAPEPGPDRHP